MANVEGLDSQTRGWMEQLAARIADNWGNPTRAEDLQRQAYAHNKNLVRPKVLPPYRPLVLPGQQEQTIARRIAEYRLRATRGSARVRGCRWLSHEPLAKLCGVRAQFLDSPGEHPGVWHADWAFWTGRRQRRGQKRGNAGIDVFTAALVVTAAGRAPEVEPRFAADALSVTSPSA